MKHIAIILMILSNPCKGERIFFNDGNSLEAKILEANETHVRIERVKDHQQFKFEINLLTKNSQKQIELYHSKGRYSSIPPSETPLDKKTLEGYASYIDKLINEGLRSKKLQKTKELNNEAYARRIYLTLIGRIPTKLELNTFLNNRSPEGKRDLVQKLLNSTGHINHQMNWWSDMLRVKDRINGVNINIGSVYRRWLRNAISHNKPYDQTVRELIGSSGRVYEDEQGAAISYFLRDRGMQEDNLSHTIRIFLGTRLQCAMCHDHPFDRWTQKQFYEMTAFTSGIGNVRLKEPGKAINELTKAIREDSDERAGLFNNWRNQIRDLIIFGIENNGTGEIKLPKDFVEDNGNPGDIVLAKAIFTPKPIIETKAESPNSRIALAKWITSKNNPRFTTMIANRIWKQVFGVGLIEPIDTMMDDTIASNTDLMKYIEKIMVSLNYDIREFQRVLVSTELFQRESKKHDHKSLENYSFEGPLLRRMTGEQLWDSLVTLVYNDIDEENRVYLHNQQDYSILFNKYKHMSGKEMYEEIKRLADENPGERNFAKLNKLDEHLKDMKKFKDRNLVRSSYLQSPAPGGHLIRQFGGADREQIDNSNKEPNTPQVLNLLNGFVETNILNKKDADFMSQIQSESIKNKQIESAFLSILSRKPTIKETSYLKKLINKKDGFKHIAWVLLNSHEFIFIR